MVKYGHLGGSGLGTGIALPPTHPATHLIPYPGYTPPRSARWVPVLSVQSAELKVAVGLKSVAQLSLSV